MKCVFLLLSTPLLILAQGGYGVSNDAPSSGYGPVPAAAPSYPLPVHSEPFHDVLFTRHRGHHHRRESSSESRSRSSSHSSPSDDSCRKLKSRCDKDDENCCEARVKSDTIKCSGKRGEIVQLQDGKGNLIDYGFGSVETDVKCRGERWHVRTFEGKRLRVKNVVCYRFALPAIIDVSSFETARSTPFDLDSFFDATRVSDAINWSAAVFTKNPSFVKKPENQNALIALDKAITKE